jgi:hypothetical protein
MTVSERRSTNWRAIKQLVVRIDEEDRAIVDQLGGRAGDAQLGVGILLHALVERPFMHLRGQTRPAMLADDDALFLQRAQFAADRLVRNGKIVGQRQHRQGPSAAHPRDDLALTL